MLKARKIAPQIILSALLCLVLSLLLAPSASAKIYRWVDENGQLHFSDSEQNIPAHIRNKTKEYKPDPSSLTITDDRTQPSTSASENMSEGSPPDLAAGSISIPYTAREGTANRVIIDIAFNGSITVPILLDTGSPGLVISNRLANRLGLFDRDGSQLMVLVSGIGGRQVAARTIIDKISIASIEEQFIPAHIVPDMSDAYEGLIGMDILSSYTLTIDSANQRLLAKTNPSVKNLPGGRSRSWWQTNFREFSYYTEFWAQQAELIKKSDSPYASRVPSELERLKNFISQQQNEAQNLYNQLERYARWKSVPRHWRR